MSRDTTEVFTRSQNSLNQSPTTTSSLFNGHYNTTQEHFDIQRSQLLHSTSLLFSQAGLSTQQQQQQQSKSYTYYSPVPLDHIPSPNCSSYPLPTPPLTAPIHPLKSVINNLVYCVIMFQIFFSRSYFFPTVVSPQLTKPDDLKTLNTNNELCHNHETLATALLQLQDPVIKTSTAGTGIPSSINSYSAVPYSVQSPWRPSWPYLPIMQHEYRGNPCHICGKTYARLSTLRSHLKSHTGEKPYQCSICQKSFTQAANLTAHLRTHSGEKPFKCPVCHRGFSQSSSVTTHMRTHSGDRPYKCNVCSKGFADSSTLTKHYRTHTGEKPYQCKVCEARFSQSGNLNRHMRTHQQHFGIQQMQDPVSAMDVGGVSVGISIGEYSGGMNSTDLSKLEMVVLSEGRVSI